MSRIRRSIYATAAAGLVGAALAIAPATPAMAIPACPYEYECNYTWYTSSSKTLVSGAWTILCDGTHHRTGTQTPYLTFISAPCN